MGKQPYSSTSPLGGDGSKPIYERRNRKQQLNLDKPNFDWWLKKAYWGKHEANLLLINLDPTKNKHTFDPTKLPDDALALYRYMMRFGR